MLSNLKSKTLGDGIQVYCIIAHSLIAADGMKSQAETAMLLYHGRKHFGVAANELQERMQRAQAASIAAIGTYGRDILPFCFEDLAQSATKEQLVEVYSILEELAWCDGLTDAESELLGNARKQWGISEDLAGVGSTTQGKAEELYEELMKKSNSGCLLFLLVGGALIGWL